MHDETISTTNQAPSSAFNRLSVGFRLSLLSWILLGFLLATNLMGGFGLNAVTEALTASYQDRTVPMVGMGKAIDELNKAKSNLFLGMDAQYQADTDRYFTVMKAADKSAQSNMDSQLSKLTTPTEKQLGEAYANKLAAYQSIKQKLLTTFIDDADRPSAMVIFRTEYSAAFDQLITSINFLFKYQDNKAASEFKKASASASLIQRVNMGITAFGILFASFLAVWIIRSISRPLSRAIEVAEQISNNDLTSQIQPVQAGKNETSRLTNALATMQASLQSVLRGIQNNAVVLTNASTAVSGSFGAIAQSSAQQSDAAQSIAAAIEEMTVGFSQVRENTQSALTKAETALVVSAKGQTEVGKAEREIGKIVDVVKQASQSIESLERYSLEIHSIAGVIKEIADQTNLLALNAAIEAARAGEEGRGFAVVADEVRKLAEKTTQATSSIQTVLKTVQTETGRAAESMSESTKQVNIGVATVSALVPTFNQLSSGSEQARLDLTDLALSTKEQAMTSNSIAQSVNRIADMVEQNNAGVSSTSSTVKELERLALELKEAVGQFKL